MAEQKSNVKIQFTSDATQVTKDLADMGKSSEQFSTKLLAVSQRASDLDKYLDGAGKGFEVYGSRSNKYLTSLSNQLSNASLSAKELAVQTAKLNVMKFGGSSADVATAGELAAKIYDVKNASKEAAAEGDKLASAMQRIGHYGVGAFAAFNLVGTIGNIVNVTAEFQRLQSSLVTVEGSAYQAEQSFALIQDFAQKTPYQLTEVTDAFIKMKAMGLDASLEAMQSYGDTASAMGKPLMQMIEAVADAATGEFERLKEFGIKASSQGDRVSFTFKGVTTEVGKNAQEIEQYLIKLGNTNFGGGMARQMETLGGAISNMKDKWDSAFNALGTAAEPAIVLAINTVGNLADGVNKTSGYIDEAATIAGVGLTVALTAKAIPAIAATAVTFNAGAVSAGAFTAAIIAATRASMAFALTPIGLGLTAAAGAAIYFTTKTDETALAINKLTAASKELYVQMSSGQIKNRAEELVELEKKLKDALDTSDVVVDQAKFNSYVEHLRTRIYELKNLSEETGSLNTQSAMLLNQERGMGTQLEMLNRQTRDFGVSVSDANKLIWEQGAAIASVKQPMDEWDRAIEIISDEFKKLHEQSAQDLANPTDAAFKAKLAARTKAIADAKEATKRASDEAKRALDDWFDNGFSGAEKASQKLSEFHTRLESDLQRIRYEIDPTLEAFDQYNSKLNTLALAMQTGKITADEYHDAIFQLDSKQFDSPLSGMKDKGLDDLRELKQAIDGWGKDSARSIADFALSGKGSFSDFANSVIKDLMTMMIYQNMTKPLMTAAGSWMSSLFNGGMNWSSGNAVVAAQNASFNAHGNAFTGVGIQAFANGGIFTNSIVNSPTAFKFANGGKFNLGVMGEAGPEAVMPLTRIGGKLGVLAQGGGGGHTNVIVNVMNSAGDSVQANARQSTNSNGDTVIDVMVDRVKGALLQDVGSNGQFSQAFSGAYGLSRRAF